MTYAVPLMKLKKIFYRQLCLHDETVRQVSWSYSVTFFHVDDDGDEVIISYKHWSDEGSGFTSLTDRHTPCDNIIDKLILKIDDLTRHHYTPH